MAHHAEFERADLERLAGGTLGGVFLALYGGLDGWNGMLLATLAGTLSLVVPCFYSDRGPACAASIARPRWSPVAGLRRVGHA
jgi:hypothetical protein